MGRGRDESGEEGDIGDLNRAGKGKEEGRGNEGEGINFSPENSGSATVFCSRSNHVKTQLHATVRPSAVQHNTDSFTLPLDLFPVAACVHRLLHDFQSRILFLSTAWPAHYYSKWCGQLQ